jgi:hypothetical protein
MLMPNRQHYHISARLDGESLILREQLNRQAVVPTTQLLYTPSRDDEAIPVTVYWKTALPDDCQLARVRRQVIDYCAQLYQEQDYEGPINCCL